MRSSEQAQLKLQPRRSELIGAIGKVVLGTLVLTIAAKTVVPTWPVPITLQSFAVAIIAAAYGWRLGTATVLFYLLEGAVGLPVFATGSGIGYLTGPTGGFLLGFIPMALAIGLFTERHRALSMPALLFGMLAGDALLFFVGLCWLVTLSLNVGWVDQENVLGSAFARGVQPFLIWDIVKMVLAAITVIQIRAVRTGA